MNRKQESNLKEMIKIIQDLKASINLTIIQGLGFNVLQVPKIRWTHFSHRRGSKKVAFSYSQS